MGFNKFELWSAVEFGVRLVVGHIEGMAFDTRSLKYLVTWMA